MQALIKEFLFYLWCKNVVCTVFLSDAKDKMDSSHALHTNNIFLTNTINIMNNIKAVIYVAYVILSHQLS